jgi:hypothetical protein
MWPLAGDEPAGDFSVSRLRTRPNQVTGFPNTPVNIAAGAAQTYVFALTPSATIAPTDVQLDFVAQT